MTYADMTREELTAIKVDLEEQIGLFKARNLNLNMARGKPSAEQLDLSTEMHTLLKTPQDCFSENGVDCRTFEKYKQYYPRAYLRIRGTRLFKS